MRTDSKMRSTGFISSDSDLSWMSCGNKKLGKVSYEGAYLNGTLNKVYSKLWESKQVASCDGVLPPYLMLTSETQIYILLHIFF